MVAVRAVAPEPAAYEKGKLYEKMPQNVIGKYLGVLLR